MTVTLRALRLRDFSYARRLARDPAVRQQSWNQKPPTFWGHVRWMRAWLFGHGRMAWIVLAARPGGRRGPHRAGLVRVQREDYRAVIGIAIAEHVRGRGLGRAAIEEATIEAVSAWGLPVYAEIRMANLPSIRAFAAAGYKVVSDRGQDTAVMVFTP